MIIDTIELFNTDMFNTDALIQELRAVVASVKAEDCKTKLSDEKNREGDMLYAPKVLNSCFKRSFYDRGWVKASMKYSLYKSVKEYEENKGNYIWNVGSRTTKNAETMHRVFDEVDYYKEYGKEFGNMKVAIEQQFGKYAFAARENLYKLPYIHAKGKINIGIGIYPMMSMSEDMSSGVASFEKALKEVYEASPSYPLIMIGIAP